MGIQNKIKIICEELHKDSIWYKQIFTGLTKELKKKRMSYQQVSDAQSIKAEDTVYVIGAGQQWIQQAVDAVNLLEITPVLLCYHTSVFVKGRYHLICPDLALTMKKLSLACRKAGREKIALYGVQNLSGIHAGQLDGLLELVKDTGDIYINNSSLESCFRSFLPYADRYDTVVCLSGYAAVSLVKKLEAVDQKLLSHLAVISCEEILLSSRYKNHISFVDMKLDTFGSTAVAVSEMAAGKENKLTCQALVEGVVAPIVSQKTEEKLYTEETEEYLMFADPEEVCMARVEQLLESADEVDNVIIELLMNNATYSQIADDCYMTESNVKYRVKKYLSICKVGTKKELLDMLQEYWPY